MLHKECYSPEFLLLLSCWRVATSDFLSLPETSTPHPHLHSPVLGKGRKNPNCDHELKDKGADLVNTKSKSKSFFPEMAHLPLIIRRLVTHCFFVLKCFIQHKMITYIIYIKQAHIRTKLNIKMRTELTTCHYLHAKSPPFLKKEIFYLKVHELFHLCI